MAHRPGEPRNGKSVTDNEPRSRDQMKTPEKQPVRVLRSADLLANGREVVIDHGGEHYLLRCTSNGKLILTK
ncbi:MAG: hemin uptake protein HemP [Alphaproteobacteria bacterium]